MIVAALGQAFFSLSLGMGILVTYSSYFPKTIKMVRTSVTVTFLDFMVSVLMGIIIFPAVISFGISGSENMAGMTLVFVTLPEIFAQMGGSQWWSALFFLLLGVAAITSTISIAEVSTNLAGFPSVEYAGHTIITHLMDYSSIRMEMGYASAIATILFLIMILANLGVRKILRRVGA